MTEHLSGRPAGAPENKAFGLQAKAVGNDLSDAFGEFMQAFESFKDANDERLAELESRSGADVLTTEKVDRISKALDDHKKALDQLALKQMRPTLERGAPTGPSEHKQAFEAYMRGGDEQPIRALDAKAMSYGSGQDGGYLVPPETEAEIGKRLAAFSPMRALASVRQVSSAVLKKPFAVTGAATGWVAETAARPQTASPTLQELTFQTMELYAQPAATQMLLDDAVVNLDEWIAAEVETAFATQEGAAFINGDGVNKPKGFLAYPTADEASWSWGNLGYVATGVSGALPAANPSDKLVDLVYALKAGFRQNGAWPRASGSCKVRMVRARGPLMKRMPLARPSRWRRVTRCVVVSSRPRWTS